MNLEIALSLIILVIAVVLFVTERLRVDLVAMLVMVSLVLIGIITPEQALAGLANHAVVTVGAVLVLSAGLARTGVANRIGNQVMKIAGRNEVRLIAMIMLTAGIMSAFMNDIGVAALLLPVVVGIAARSGLPPSKLLIPLAFGSLLGGLNTLIGTPPNILVSDILDQYGLESFGMFDYTPVGFPMMLAGIAFMALFGRRLLPSRNPVGEISDPEKEGGGARDLYALEERLALVTLPENSGLAGKTLAETRIGRTLGITVLALQRKGREQISVSPETVLESNDRLIAVGRTERLEDLSIMSYFTLERDGVELEQLLSEEIGLAEFVLDAESPLTGQTISQIGIRRKFDLNVLAIRRNRLPRRTNLQDVVLMDGDILLLQGRKARLEEFSEAEGIRLLSEPGREDELSVTTYNLQDRLLTIRIPEESPLAGTTLSESKMVDIFGLVALGIRRNGSTELMPGPKSKLHGGDVILVEGNPDDLKIVRELQLLIVTSQPDLKPSDLESDRVGLTEAVLSPYSSLAGNNLRQIQFREKYGLSVLAIFRNDRVFRSDLGSINLHHGDTFLLYGPRERINLLSKERDFVVLSEEAQEIPRTNKAPLAVLIMVGVLLTVVIGWLDISIAALAGASLMVLAGVLNMEGAYQSIEWKAIFLIAGMLSLGIAMEQTGAARLIADGLVSIVGGFGPLAVVAGFFILTTLSTQVMPNPAVAVLLAPIAINTAGDLGMSAQALMMTIALAASAAFLSPVGHPLNVLVMGPGGYRFSDYLKAGLPLSFVVLIVVLIFLPIFWPLT